MEDDLQEKLQVLNLFYQETYKCTESKVLTESDVFYTTGIDGAKLSVIIQYLLSKGFIEIPFNYDKTFYRITSQGVNEVEKAIPTSD